MDSNNSKNSCLMLACSLYTPVSLSGIFDSEDLKDTKIELESHITILYAQGIKLPKDNMISDIKDVLGEDDFYKLNKLLEDGEIKNVFDYFDLGVFENDSDYVVLKLKKESGPIFEYLNIMNKGLKAKYDVPSAFAEYTPHLSLAELNPGTASKYYESKKLKAVLNNSKVSMEDLVLSYGLSNEKEDRLKYNLTKYHAVDRFFREENLKKENEEDLN